MSGSRSLKTRATLTASWNGVEIAQAGEGFDLNFQNADVNAVAKVLLGDVLGATYSVDPRVQGPINLSSARSVFSSWWCGSEPR